MNKAIFRLSSASAVLLSFSLAIAQTPEVTSDTQTASPERSISSVPSTTTTTTDAKITSAKKVTKAKSGVAANSKASGKGAAKSSAKTSAKAADTAGSKKTANSNALLSDVSKKYRGNKVAKISTSKKVTSELLGKTTNYDGTIYLAQGKFRWENETPEQSLLLFDGSTIYNVQYPPKDLGGPVQVAKAKLDKNTKSQVLITTLLGTQPISKNFHVEKSSSQDNVTTLELKPITGDLRVKALSLNIDTKAKLIRTISYKDDVNNTTVIELTKTDFLTKEPKDLFKFKIPKDAQVTNL